jgi:cob(I)alamin adenosyltransferase
MGNRLTKIYTRTGDSGMTGLGDGSRVEKESLRIEALGTVDELNSVIGKLICHPLPDSIATLLSAIQHHLFDLGGELCIPGHQLLPVDRSQWLEQQLDTLNAELPPLKEFILPGGCAAAAECHFARTVCRRAERVITHLSRSEAVNPPVIAYLNRLSDLLFVLARHINKVAGVADVLWQREHPNQNN